MFVDIVSFGEEITCVHGRAKHIKTFGQVCMRLTEKSAVRAVPDDGSHGVVESIQCMS